MYFIMSPHNIRPQCQVLDCMSIESTLFTFISLYINRMQFTKASLSIKVFSKAIFFKDIFSRKYLFKYRLMKTSLQFNNNFKIHFT